MLFAPLALLDLLPGFAVFSSAACLALALWLLLRDALLLGDARLLGDAPRRVSDGAAWWCWCWRSRPSTSA